MLKVKKNHIINRRFITKNHRRSMMFLFLCKNFVCQKSLLDSMDYLKSKFNHLGLETFKQVKLVHDRSRQEVKLCSQDLLSQLLNTV